MKILAIETSCDETAIAIVEATGDESGADFTVLGNALLSQIDIHREYGGVLPMLAKREHAKNLVPILEAALEEAEMLKEDTQAVAPDIQEAVTAILEREPGLSEQFLEFITETETPDIDAVAVTAGPGLEPALWVGINFAKALALAWKKPIVAVNHMEGHILSGLAKKKDENALSVRNLAMPVLALLISGGHTELVLMRDWLRYELIGQTRDDAVGEAFDKVARLLSLPYPGGPEISKLAEQARKNSDPSATAEFKLPRPMIKSDDCDFSFSGLKTSVLYMVKDKPELPQEKKEALAQAFEDTVAEVLWAKTARALEQTDAQTLVLGGGVSANTHIRRVFTEQIQKNHEHVALHIPSADLTTDNAVMIALAGFYHAQREQYADPVALTANGNLCLTH